MRSSPTWPGATSAPPASWTLLAEGRDGIGEAPPERWAPYVAGDPETAAAVRRTLRPAGYLADIAGFDAAFFGISPREALSIDPQQRMLLETCWEALERAGIPPRSLRGTDTGVFMAGNSHDYGDRLMEDLPRLEAWALNGTYMFGLANRLSHALDLHGSSLAVDTACAGSLTALHMACQHLWRGEVDLAVTGGANVMAAPGIQIVLNAAGATAADGRSKSFDAAADGYGRGEGVGVVILKRLTDAQRDGDPVLALVRGGGVFHDGTGEDMMAPNGAAQERMLRHVYERSGVSPASVGYVETHGTGTPAGDPVEANALAAFFGTGRPAERPCLIGSVKPNIGHLEAAAGIAGVIKAVLCLRHREIAASLHSEPSGSVDWDRCGLKVVPALTPWPDEDGPARAAVSSFGVGGTIAHVILEQAPPSSVPPPRTRRSGARSSGSPSAAPRAADEAAAGPHVFPLSSMSEAGVQAQAARLADWIAAHPDTPAASIGRTLARHRSHLAYRSTVVAAGTAQLAERLGAPEPFRALSQDAQVDPVWVFSGHGAQWDGMGRELLAEEPVFAAAIDELEPVYREELGYSAREAIMEGDWSSAARVQAITFAMQVALADLWRTRGLRPGAIVGHSVGEIAAAVVAGALDRTQAARFACRRSQVVRRAAGHGGMAMVALPFEQASKRLIDRDDLVAAVNAAPNWSVVSGSAEALRTMEAECAEEGITVRHVGTDIPFHSPYMGPLIDDVRAAARELDCAPPAVPMYSSVTEDPRSAADRDDAYWTAMLREPVRFADAIEAAVADGHRLFVEVSSHPVVSHSISEILEDLDVEEGAAVCSLRRGRPELETLLGSLGELHCRGARIDWSALYPDGPLLDLPTMAWQRRPFWPAVTGRAAQGGGHDPAGHTLLGARTTVNGSSPTRLWQTHLDYDRRPYPDSHPVHDIEIVPAAVLLNTFFTAGGAALADVDLRIPVAVTAPRAVQVIQQDDHLRLCTRLTEDSGGDEKGWITHTTATVVPHEAPADWPDDPEALRARCAEQWPWDRIEELFRRRGIGGYGFSWTVEELHRGDGELIATLTAPAGSSWAPLLDGALTMTPLLLPDDESLRMPAHIAAAGVEGEPPHRALVHARLNGDRIDVSIADESTRVLARIGGLRFDLLDGPPGAFAPPQRLVHELTWVPLDYGTFQEILIPIVVVGAHPADRDWLARAGVDCLHAETPQEAVALRPGTVLVPAAPPDPGESPHAAARRNALALARTAQELHGLPCPVALWSLTRGVRDGRELAHASVPGMARIIAGEHPDIWGGIIDVEGEPTGERLLDVLRTGADQDVIALTPDAVRTARLAPVQRNPSRPATVYRPDSTYLITGGLGALGLEVAHWLAGRGARRLVLLGRRGLPPRREWDAVTDAAVLRRIDSVRALEALGVMVRVVACDIADADQAAAALDPAALDMPPVRGIVHAAGVVRDTRLIDLDESALAEVMRPKADGAMVLHDLFPPGTLDFFCLFSSSGQYTRITGQAAYAAANSFLDALATHRPDAISLGWMTWRDMGMSESNSAGLAEANARGLDAISATEAFEAWRLAERLDSSHLAIARVIPTPAPAVVLSQLPVTDDIPETTSAPVRSEDLPADVCAQIAAELKMDPAEIDQRRPLAEMGLDSVMTVRLRARLTRSYGVELPPTLLWEQPTARALITYLEQQLAPQDGD
ncbi:type I polyketide synthase [Actinomadura sp. NAK00032]|uniref:type I polyketide synthase n=1 Tax=Actinomadura sp. NAK00032 TaxID=2742128 RepID=UPI001C376A15|nr:type I polyketide synthase [Actinomadura sp. NAK00032]